MLSNNNIPVLVGIGLVYGGRSVQIARTTDKQNILAMLLLKPILKIWVGSQYDCVNEGNG